jgi:K+-transporting ATPase ATPase A chain
MSADAWVQAVATLAILTAFTVPVGRYLYAVFTGARTFLHPVLAPVEQTIYRLARIRPDAGMSWQTYIFAMLAMSAVSIAWLYLLLRVQQWLPLNPQGFGNVAPDLALNTAISFATTTDWQAYSGESSLGYLAQMAGCAWQNFIAAGVGLALAIAFIRGLAHAGTSLLGNFWVDLTRGLLYVLLPLSVLGALVFTWQGVPQNFTPYLDVTTLDGSKQTLTGGPMASQEIIKLLGGNGGGFVGANSASPNENPTAFTNLVQLVATLLIPVALTHTFGLMVRDRRQGWALFAAMGILVVGGVLAASWTETAGNPAIHQLGIAGPNMEGKETRFGAAGAGLSVAIATDATTGAANVTYDSLMPLTTLVAMVNMQLGEVAFGGVGSGIAGLLVFAVLTVFTAGLMVGRTPEYLGKKVERREITCAMLAVLTFPLAILLAAGVAAVIPAGTSSVGNGGPRGLSEIVYAFTSVAAGNGSALAALNANTPYYNIVTGFVMLVGRYAVAVPTLALAGAFAARAANLNPTPAGTFSTSSPLFVTLLVAVVLIVGALTFVPADALGPVADDLLLRAGTTF